MALHAHVTSGNVELRFTGTVRREDLRLLARELQALDRAAVHLPRLVDLSGVRVWELGFNDLLEFCRWRLPMTSTAPTRWGLFVSEPWQYGVARMWQANLQDVGCAVEVFRDPTELAAWIEGKSPETRVPAKSGGA